MFIRILLPLLPAFSPSSSITFHRLPNPPSALVSSAFFFSLKLECFALYIFKLISELQQAVSGVRPFQQYVLPPVSCLRCSGASQSPNCLPLQEPAPPRRRLEQAGLKRSRLGFVIAEHLQRPRRGSGTGTLASHVRRGGYGRKQAVTTAKAALMFCVCPRAFRSSQVSTNDNLCLRKGILKMLLSSFSVSPPRCPANVGFFPPPHSFYSLHKSKQA